MIIIIKTYFFFRFVITEKLVRTLCPEFLSEQDKVIVQIEKSEENEETGDKEKNDENGKSNSFKLKGQNKKRPPPMKFTMEERICPSLVNVAEGESVKECAFGEKCSYQHDLAAYVGRRKSDQLPGGCYVYQTLGRCNRGVSCLFGSEHLTPEGRNKVNPNPTDPGSSTYSNFLSKDLQKELRKKQYSFKQAMSVVERNKNLRTKKDEEEEPETKKICLGAVTNEDVIALKASEKKKVIGLTDFAY